MTLFNSGSIADGDAQRLREGRVAGHPGDAAVAVLPVPDRDGRERRRRSSGYEIAAKLSLWLRGTTPSDALLDSAPASGTARHRRRRGGAGDDHARRADRDGRRCGSSTASSCTSIATLHISKVNVPTYKEALNAEFAGDLVPLLRQDLHAGAGREADPDVDDRLRRARDGAALRRDGARQRLRRARPRRAARRLLLAAAVPDAATRTTTSPTRSIAASP